MGHLDEQGIYETVQAPNSPVVHHLEALGQAVRQLARRQAKKSSGLLSRSIEMSTDTRGPTAPVVEVGSQLRYAFMHHEGTRPHVILPKHGGYLRFMSRGKVVYARRVYHPGTRPNHYLTDPLRTVVR